MPVSKDLGCIVYRASTDAARGSKLYGLCLLSIGSLLACDYSVRLALSGRLHAFMFSPSSILASCCGKIGINLMSHLESGPAYAKFAFGARGGASSGFRPERGSQKHVERKRRNESQPTMGNKASAPAPASECNKSDKVGIKSGKKICCCCPETKQARDECVVFKGEGECFVCVSCFSRTYDAKC
jgi:hypothetical protein